MAFTTLRGRYFGQFYSALLDTFLLLLSGLVSCPRFLTLYTLLLVLINVFVFYLLSLVFNIFVFVIILIFVFSSFFLPPFPQTLFLSPFHPNPKFSLLSTSFRSTTISPSFYCSIIHLSSLFFLIYHSFTISSKRERKMASRTSDFFSARHESFFVVKLRK